MKKIIIFALMMAQSWLYAATPGEMAHEFMRDTYQHNYQHQNLIGFLSQAVNQGNSIISKECNDTAAGKECTIQTPVTITVTKEMAEASEIFFGAGEGFEEGDVITLPAGSIVFVKLENSRFEYALTLDTSKIPDEDMDENFTFSWNTDGDILRAYYSSDTYNGSYILLKDNGGNKKMISNGYFDNHGQKGTYIMEVTLKDATTHSIVERMSFKDTPAKPPLNQAEVCSVGEINDVNGSVWIDPYAMDGASFDRAGKEISNWIDNNVTAHIAPDEHNGAILHGRSAVGHRFAIVKKGDQVDKHTILGYIFNAYDNCDGKQFTYEYEYFGSNDLLADKNATSDTDQLDVYRLDDTNKPIGNPIAGFYLTKTQ